MADTKVDCGVLDGKDRGRGVIDILGC